MHTHTHNLHVFPCFSLLNPVTHQVSGVSYSLCSFCVQKNQPSEAARIPSSVATEKCTYKALVKGKVQQTLKDI